MNFRLFTSRPLVFYHSLVSTASTTLGNPQTEKFNKLIEKIIEAENTKKPPYVWAQSLVNYYNQHYEQERLEMVKQLLDDNLFVDKDLYSSLSSILQESAKTQTITFPQLQNIRQLVQSNHEKILLKLLQVDREFIYAFRKDINRWIEKENDQKIVEKLKWLLIDVNKLYEHQTEKFVELKEISWETCSGALLEYLIKNESVHQVKSWEMIKERLINNRKCFGLFSSTANAPLIFVWMALTNYIPSSIDEIFSQSPAPSSDLNTAVFYSINSSPGGFRGIGNILLKQVCVKLYKDSSSKIKTFVTLSPIPGFSAWLRNQGKKPEDTFSPGELEALQTYFSRKIGGDKNEKSPVQLLLDEFKGSDWLSNDKFVETVRPILMRLGKRYLSQEFNQNGQALDRVANFHLSNGASVERLNWLGDKSPKGLEESAGLMVNYKYDLEMLELNFELYAKGKIPVSANFIQSMTEELVRKY